MESGVVISHLDISWCLIRRFNDKSDVGNWSHSKLWIILTVSVSYKNAA